MKTIFAFLIMIIFVGTISCQESGNKNSPKEDLERLSPPDKLIDRASYMIGYTMGENLKRDSLNNVNLNYLIAGIKDVLEDKELLISKSILDSTNNELQEMLNERMKQKQLMKGRDAEKNKEEAYAFLENNKKDKRVITLPSGLQYKIINKGYGSSPKEDDYLKIHAVARILNGKELDNSYNREQPIYIQLDPKVFKCWQESLLLMKKGSKWTLYSPPELAFGNEGNEMIPANKVMIFDLELLDFQIEPFEDAPKDLPPMDQRPNPKQF
ncbi:FKBP-type peptidyl-prolyl cis-trans isomerase N-terminal domain-containing protein [Bacteroidota bacterium]